VIDCTCPARPIEKLGIKWTFKSRNDVGPHNHRLDVRESRPASRNLCERHQRSRCFTSTEFRAEDYTFTSKMTIRLAVPVILFVFALHAQTPFYLSNGDRVVFYGDSITDQRLYDSYVETFVVTRFPKLNVQFVHSGWNGDRVSGGGGGPIDTRLDRDVISYRPTVVTINLGMNDGEYHPFDRVTFDKFAAGYEHIVDRLIQKLPGVRITAIQPSPYDDVTRPPLFEGGYNATLQVYGKFIGEFAARRKLFTADMNAPVLHVLRLANQNNSEIARQMIPDRVHPAEGTHLIMAEALLKAWNAPAVVTDVKIDAASAKALITHNTAVTALTVRSGLAWTQTDSALPFPIDWDDPTSVIPLAIHSSDFVESLDLQRLSVVSLKPGRYVLAIDGSKTGVFGQDELAAGVNLATYQTPMVKQAREVLYLTLKRAGVHHFRWRFLQISLSDDGLAGQAAAIRAVDRVESQLTAQRRAKAQPVPRRYTLEALP
jgi:lysophospholipase L1-like esterase